MKIKKDLMLRNIAGEWVVVPMGERLTEFNGLMKLNDSGAFLWKILENSSAKETLAEALLAEYDIEKNKAESEVDIFLKTLSQAGVLEE